MLAVCYLATLAGGLARVRLDLDGGGGQVGGGGAGGEGGVHCGGGVVGVKWGRREWAMGRQRLMRMKVFMMSNISHP